MIHLRNRLLYATIAAMVGVVTLSACSSTQASNQGSGQPTVTGAATATVLSTQSIYSQVAQAESQLKDISYTATIQISGEPSIQATGQIVLHPFAIEQVSATSGQQMTIILINNESYVKLPTVSQWYVLPLHSPLASSVANSSSIAQYASLAHVTLVGTETVDGFVCWHLHGNVPTSTSIVMDIWVRQDTYFPVKEQIVASNLTITYIYTAWNTGVVITAPSSAVPYPGA